MKKGSLGYGSYFQIIGHDHARAVETGSSAGSRRIECTADGCEMGFVRSLRTAPH